MISSNAMKYRDHRNNLKKKYDKKIGTLISLCRLVEENA